MNKFHLFTSSMLFLWFFSVVRSLLKEFSSSMLEYYYCYYYFYYFLFIFYVQHSYHSLNFTSVTHLRMVFLLLAFFVHRFDLELALFLVHRLDGPLLVLRRFQHLLVQRLDYLAGQIHPWILNIFTCMFFLVHRLDEYTLGFTSSID